MFYYCIQVLVKNYVLLLHTSISEKLCFTHCIQVLVKNYVLLTAYMY